MRAERKSSRSRLGRRPAWGNLGGHQGVIKEIEACRLKCTLVNCHRRIEFSELQRYQAGQQVRSEDALQKLTTMSEELGMEF